MAYTGSPLVGRGWGPFPVPKTSRSVIWVWTPTHLYVGPTYFKVLTVKTQYKNPRVPKLIAEMIQTAFSTPFLSHPFVLQKRRTLWNLSEREAIQLSRRFRRQPETRLPPATTPPWGFPPSPGSEGSEVHAAQYPA